MFRLTLADLRRILHDQLALDELQGKGFHIATYSASISQSASAISLQKAATSLVWEAVVRALTASISAREATDEWTAARALSAIANSSDVGCRPLSEKAAAICAVTDTSWAWAASA
jgi:hypothetical protein